MKARIVLIGNCDKTRLSEVTESLQMAIDCLTADDFKAQFRLYKFYRRLRIDNSPLHEMFSIYGGWAKDLCNADGAYIVVECDGAKYGIYNDDCWEEMMNECEFW